MGRGGAQPKADVEHWLRKKVHNLGVETELERGRVWSMGVDEVLED